MRVPHIFVVVFVCVERKRLFGSVGEVVFFGVCGGGWVMCCCVEVVGGGWCFDRGEIWFVVEYVV